ncbi:CDP-alcohol phosphatidyltransferase-domain-containing protein [Collybia nuda]|uniref:CDP-alcohol phosphatidyltransferase-domain-containing protein n=1 Tax=Collybia nuda TaxID=64659 RepID=A0A9P6CMP2_9AGAR|nr:CDP-alcohol phosphatidyltransferase-domain-containing protein [Collybia nuda]
MLKTTTSLLFRAVQRRCCRPSLLRTFHCNSPLNPRLIPNTPRSFPNLVVHRKYATLGSTGTPQPPETKPTPRENIYTLPNALTVSRIVACPVLGWSILQNDFTLATTLLVYAGLTDLADGYLARRFNMQTVLGTILDPAADKTLMTTLTVTLAMQGLLPVPLAVVILGRDVLLSFSAFYIRYTSLPEPKTFSRYWDFSIPSAEVRPTAISKVNTALQLGLMGVTTISPLVPYAMGVPLQGFQWIVATTTIWSGLSYIFSKDAVRIVSERRQQKPPST